MARIRTIKPELWTDAKTGTLSPKALLLFLGMLNFSDDYGVIEHCCHYLKACIFPHNTEPPGDLIAPLLLDELLPRGLVVVFSDQDTKKQYLFIRNFAKHQRVDRPGKPLIPGFNPSSFDEPSSNTRRTLANVPAGREGKGREGKGKEYKSSQAEMTSKEFFDSWNEVCASEGLETAKKLTTERERKINRVLQANPSLEFWTNVFNRIIRTPFLKGENDRGWKCNIDWLTANSTNAVKIYEGRYDKDQKTKG